MGRIVAIGGGEIGRPGHPVETTPIDRYIVRLTGRRHPRLLFLPTATRDSPTYAAAVERHFGGRLGCAVDTLYLYDQRPPHRELRAMVLRSDVIYVGGGNTARMLRRWRTMGVDRVLRQAFHRGIVLSGLSAGAICWFRHGASDSRRLIHAHAPLLRVRGLDLVPALLCPHYDERDVRPRVRATMGRTPGVALALDSCCAVVIVDGTYRIMASRRGAKAYRLYCSRGRLHEEMIPQRPDFAPFDEITRR